MYEAYFGLSAKPFQLTPDPRFFYASKEHKRAMSYLQYGLEQGEGFIVITGSIGTGKSTIAKHLLSNLNKQEVIAIQLVTTSLSPLELLQLIASGLGIKSEGRVDKAYLLQKIEHYLLQVHNQKRRTLLLVDEAQNLPAESIEELRMLSNIQKQNRPLLQSFLLGQEELRDTLKGANMEQFRQRIIASCHLHPLNPQECQDYILYRLKQVGWKNNNPSFSEPAFNLIHKYTRGVPRLVNLFCDRIMLFSYLEEEPMIEQSAIEMVNKEFSQEIESKPELKKIEPQKIVKNQVINSASSDVHLFREHLEEVFTYLDKTMMDKLKLLRYLDRAIKEKNAQVTKIDQKSLP